VLAQHMLRISLFPKMSEITSFTNSTKVKIQTDFL
jgi:hypothetical protein